MIFAFFYSVNSFFLLMTIEQNVSLRSKNTFGIESISELYVEVKSISDLEQACEQPNTLRVLGGGSNILLTGSVSGLVMKNCLKGRKIVAEDADNVWIESASGEIWHDLVMYTVVSGWGGLENLALIPGTVGAAPIQNIGAYGTEVANVITEVRWYDMKHKKHITTAGTDCEFGYRDSIFKRALAGTAYITSVVCKLSKKPVLNIGYGAIADELERMNTMATVLSVAEAVMRIRQSKLPDPKVTGNAGSFFKNPIITQSDFTALSLKYPAMPSYDAGNNLVKVPAGWLIEKCGWKGYTTRSGAGVHEKQALVLVNKGNATGKDIWQLSEDIMNSVKHEFGITLEREVQIW
jgi:UDP-N-acetylmuramate dehydrogenase